LTIMTIEPDPASFEDDFVLTDPVDWTWTFGDDHQAVEPASVLLPGRVDAPAADWEGSSVLGQFDSQAAAAAAADSLSGICVAETVILPNQPWPYGGSPRREKLPAVIDAMTAAGAREAFVTDADTGRLTWFDVRVLCRDRDQALELGRRMGPIFWSPWFKGLVKPWAPGRTLSEEQIRSRMYIARLWRGLDRQARDERESKIRQIWRDWQEAQEKDLPHLLATGRLSDEVGVAGKKYEAALRSFMGEEPEEWGSPWYLSGTIRVEDHSVCLSWLWFEHVSTGFPALVRWLLNMGVQSAEYSIYNLSRP
jgi:hypothetical protein